MLEYKCAGSRFHHDYVLPPLLRELECLPEKRVFDIGCGTGAIDQALSESGFDVTAIDPSESGIALARANYPDAKFEVGNCYDDLAGAYGTFPIVISIEVIEHLYDPRLFIQRARAMLKPGGTLIVSTPYNGYLKNVALALTNRFDRHLDPLFLHGHIKFWSVATLWALLTEEGFRDIRFHRVGRIPPLAKSVIAVARQG